MDTNAVSFAALSMISMCGSPSSAPEPAVDPYSPGEICWAYDKMLEVELLIGQECNVDTDCQQVLTGTGCGCETDDLIANNSYDATYFYELQDDALAEGCAIEFNTACDCNADAEPACLSGTCVWN